MKIRDLKPNVKNPRRISAKKLDLLKASLVKFGDLSGFVYNRRTRTLISGHQRQKSLGDATVKIEAKYDTPTKSYTVAEGYVEFDGERFKYREVDAPREWEAEALLAANQHGGEWDRELLQVFVADFADLDFGVAGFEVSDLSNLGIRFEREPVVSAASPTPPTSSSPFSSDDDDPVKGDDAAESDEQYVSSTPQTTEEIPTENPFAGVEEKLDSKLTRHIVIVECNSVDVRDAIRSKLRESDFIQTHGSSVKVY